MLDDAYTVSLLHCDGADSGTMFIDESGKTVTAYNHAHTEQDQSKFGGTSAYFDGTDDYLIIDSSSDFNLPGLFTVDMWIRLDSDSQQAFLISAVTAGGISFGINIDGPSRLTFGRSLTANDAIGSFVWSANQWYHVAAQRDLLNYLSLWVDENPIFSQTGVTINYNTSALNIGRENSGKYYGGYIDEFRISKGIARYSLAVPTRAYSNAKNYLHARRDRMNMRGVSTQNQLE